MSKDIKKALIDHYRWLRRYGYNDSHSGNASVRQDANFWVTPTGACADTLKAKQLKSGEVNGAIEDGASLDAPLHQRIYRLQPQHGAVLHSHGPYSIAMTMNGEDYRPIDFEGEYYFPTVPVISIPYERYVDEAPQRVAECLSEYRVCVVRGHGVYAAGEDLNLAYKWTCSLESSARIHWLTLNRPLPDHG